MRNIALNRPTSASSFVIPYAAANAVNGTSTPFSRWLCNTLPCWMYVDLGTPAWVNQWIVRHMPVAGWKSPDYVNSDFKLQGSNDTTNWTDVDIVIGNTASVVSRMVNPVSFRYFRVYISKGLIANNKMASLLEFELYPAPPTSSLLTSLSLSSGTLSPVFSKNTMDYTATVANDASSITVTPVSEDPGATIKVNGTIVASGTLSSAINLNVGSNIISVVVTSLIGGIISTYTFTVTRLESAYMSGITVQSRSGAVSLTPSFVKTIQSYTSNVANSITSVTFTPTAESSTGTITINGTAVTSGQVSPSFNLTEGNNTYSIVTTSGGATYIYTIAIARAYNLLLNKADIAYVYRGGTGNTTVTMDSTNLNYNVILPNNPISMTIAAFAASTNVVVTINGVVVPSGAPSVSINVISGMVVSITVSSPDNTQTRSYTLTVT